MPAAVQADLDGRTCLVTGASGGIGLAAARELARLGARVVLAVRSPERGEAARRAIGEATGSAAVEVAVVDLSSQASISAFARELPARHGRLDVLVNNAGVWTSRKRRSADGIELTWATNVLGYHLATVLLLPLLRAAGRARVVNVASDMAGGLDLTDVQYDRRPWTGRAAYAQSKQADRLLTWALARRLVDTGVTANAMHPGFVATGIFAKGGGVLGRVASLYARLRARTPQQGADTVVYLATSPEVEGRSGRYWADRQERPCGFRDERLEETLWLLCEAMTAA
ncbi:MAG TPA: SDR family NAD(P)-dependent oxidoreductase [Vicinamibacteria bacterium]|nr:SDR family NAD(P)-dependent oxidoreductase [Vicinamibacteria bacterium]